MMSKIIQKTNYSMIFTNLIQSILLENLHLTMNNFRCFLIDIRSFFRDLNFFD